MPSFNINIDSELVECWDNEDYLINILYPYLSGKLDDLTENEIVEFDSMFSCFKDELLRLFEKAFEMGLLKR